MQVLCRLCAIRYTRALSSPVSGRLDRELHNTNIWTETLRSGGWTCGEFFLWSLVRRVANTSLPCVMNASFKPLVEASFGMRVTRVDYARSNHGTCAGRCCVLLIRGGATHVSDGVLRTLCLWACDNTSMNETNLSLLSQQLQG